MCACTEGTRALQQDLNSSLAGMYSNICMERHSGSSTIKSLYWCSYGEGERCANIITSKVALIKLLIFAPTPYPLAPPHTLWFHLPTFRSAVRYSSSFGSRFHTSTCKTSCCCQSMCVERTTEPYPLPCHFQQQVHSNAG